MSNHCLRRRAAAACTRSCSFPAAAAAAATTDPQTHSQDPWLLTPTLFSGEGRGRGKGGGGTRRGARNCKFSKEMGGGAPAWRRGSFGSARGDAPPPRKKSQHLPRLTHTKTYKRKFTEHLIFPQIVSYNLKPEQFSFCPFRPLEALWNLFEFTSLTSFFLWLLGPSHSHIHTRQSKFLLAANTRDAKRLCQEEQYFSFPDKNQATFCWGDFRFGSSALGGWILNCIFSFTSLLSHRIV